MYSASAAVRHAEQGSEGPCCRLRDARERFGSRRVYYQAGEAAAQTFVCSPADEPFARYQLEESPARALGQAISERGLARPA